VRRPEAAPVRGAHARTLVELQAPGREVRLRVRQKALQFNQRPHSQR